MPPKRKQPAVKETKVEEHFSDEENKDEEAVMETKPVDEVEDKPRRGKPAKGKPEEDVADEPKEKKSRGRGAKKVEEEVEEEKPKKSGRPAKAEKPKRGGGRKKAEENGDAKDDDAEKPKRGGKAKSEEKDDKKTDEEREDSASPAPESVDSEDDAKIGKNGKAPSKSGSVDSKASHEDDDKTEDEKVSDSKESDEEAPVEVKPKRGRAAKAAANEVKPKKGRGARKAAEPVAPADERPKRNKAAKKYYDDDENEDGEPIIKKSKEDAKLAKQAKEEAKIARDAAKEEARIAKEEAKAAKDEETKLANQTVTDYSTIEFGCEKKNELGKEFNFKIASWNVDGLRAWFKKDGLLYLEHEKPDVICFQETKCSEDNIPDEVKEFEGYEKYWLGGEKEGYAGVSVFSKTKPIDVQYGVGDESLDVEGRCLTLEFETFYLINTYVPNAGRKLVNMDKRLEWNKTFKDFVKKLDEKKPVIVCGDLNVAHNDIDLTNPKANKKNAGFTQEERDGLTDFLESGFVDTYRKLHPETENVYTFWTYMMKSRTKNIGWRLDYFLVSERFMNTVCESQIRDKIFGSDHCPIALFLNV